MWRATNTYIIHTCVGACESCSWASSEAREQVLDPTMVWSLPHFICTLTGSLLLPLLLSPRMRLSDPYQPPCLPLLLPFQFNNCRQLLTSTPLVHLLPDPLLERTVHRSPYPKLHLLILLWQLGRPKSQCQSIIV